jgi:hypothetical protein
VETCHEGRWLPSYRKPTYTNLAMYHFLFKIKTHTLHLKAEKVTNDLKSASHEQMCKSNIIPELNKEAPAHKMTEL